MPPVSDNRPGARARIMLEISEDRLEQLNKVMQDCGMQTRKELFDHALTLFEWAVEHVKAGAAIGALTVDTNTFSTLKMPALDEASRQRIPALRAARRSR
jgi:hypothetical protein